MKSVEEVYRLVKVIYQYICWKIRMFFVIVAIMAIVCSPVHGSATAIAGYRINDPFYRYQWGLHNDGTITYQDAISKRTHRSVYGMDAKVENAWNYLGDYYNREKVIVAIVDTGIDYTHPDLADHIWTNSGEIANDGIDNDNNGYIDDVHGWNFYDNNNQVFSLDSSKDGYHDNHGTHCAGTIIADHNNGIGIAGIASKLNVEVMIIKAIGGENGTEQVNSIKSSSVQAIEYAEQMGADICNLSIGSYAENQDMTKVIEGSDMLFVCACGNDGKNTDIYPVWPASYSFENVISVADLTPSGTLSNYSNYGSNSVSVAAPGTRIAGTSVNGEYLYLSGTSMAAPMVSGIAAMLYAYRPGIDASTVKQILMNSVTKIDALDGKVASGGIINAYQALAYDFHLPEIVLVENQQKKSNRIVVTVTTFGGMDTEIILWAEGNQTGDYFADGTEGSIVEDGQFTVTKTGTYTVYARNKNGLYAVETIQCKVGNSPIINTSVTKSKKSSNRIIKIKVTDEDNNIQSVYYATGSHTESEFSNKELGKRLKLNKSGKVNITGKKNKQYSIYVIDKNGNETIKLVKCR